MGSQGIQCGITEVRRYEVRVRGAHKARRGALLFLTRAPRQCCEVQGCASYCLAPEAQRLDNNDALLASIAETEKQTELATRVSTWKQRIEHTLEEQDTHSPFDIHQYGEIILDKLSLGEDNGGCLPFTDVVWGQPKHDVARTFSALLQLVNNGDVELQRAPANGELICYTAENPFGVRLLRRSRRKEEMGIYSSRKRVKSLSNNRCSSKANPSTSEPISPSRPSHQNGRLSVKLGKGTVVRCTPEGKRRRRSRIAEAVDLQPAG